MRSALVNENSDLVAQNPRYVVRITGDSEEGKAELDNFIFPESRYPVIATTSKLMSTGIDAQTCKLIVLDQTILSMTEFKQRIGRGTRINEEYGKYYFTIMDFKKATELFADPDFDGDPVQIYTPQHLDDSPVPPDIEGNEDSGEESLYPETDYEGREWLHVGNDNDGEDGPARVRCYVVDSVEVKVIAERVQYFDADGKLITESLKDYTRKTLSKEFASLEDFLNRWNSAEKKQVIIEELSREGVFFDALSEEISRDYDPFDLICHVAWDKPPLTRRERAEQVKKNNYFTKYGAQAQRVLETLLDKYADEGIVQIETPQILSIAPFTLFGTPVEIIRIFNGFESYQQAVQELEQALYSA